MQGMALGARRVMCSPHLFRKADGLLSACDILANNKGEYKACFCKSKNGFNKIYSS
jgi:hypothetical protein